jgi:hypothetical protein
VEHLVFDRPVAQGVGRTWTDLDGLGLGIAVFLMNDVTNLMSVVRTVHYVHFNVHFTFTLRYVKICLRSVEDIYV